MQGWEISCGSCGVSSPAAEWLRTVMGDLPAGDFQCPRCKAAVRRVPVGGGMVGEGDYACFIPESIKLLKIPSRL